MTVSLKDIPVRFPEKYDASWFQTYHREVLGKADIRYAVGVGLSITSDGNSNATLTNAAGSASTLTVGDDSADLPNSRQLVVEADLTLVDGGAGDDATLGLAAKGTAGTYTKVTTDAKGQVTAGTTLDPTDIPALDTSKITTGTFADARIAASNVTQHQAALTITRSQISDLPIQVGTGAPATTPSNGTLYIRTDGAASTSLYMRIGGAWLAATFA